MDIKNMIYEIRGKQVMLDSDLAKLYKCTNGTKDINKSVKRNIDRFPQDFYFELTMDECSRFHFGTLNVKRGQNIKYLPHVFTEQGVAMLATVLNTKVASEVSVNIMRAFVEMRRYISNNLIEQKYINNLVLEHDSDIKILKETFNEFKEINNHLFFKGQIYDAYSLMLDIFNKSKKEIIIIDNYIDKNILDILGKTDKKIIVITNDYNKSDYTKYIQEYSNVTIKISKDYHDRFIVIDREILYHCGASFKDLGKKCFEISKIVEESVLNLLLDNIKEVF